jgi:hypothetical protein
VTIPSDLLTALLGPAEPELTCEECFEQLDHYVDLELAAVDADCVVPGMRAHMPAARPVARITRACSSSPAPKAGCAGHSRGQAASATDHAPSRP